MNKTTGIGGGFTGELAITRLEKGLQLRCIVLTQLHVQLLKPRIEDRTHDRGE